MHIPGTFFADFKKEKARITLKFYWCLLEFAWISDVTWGHCVLRVIQHQNPLAQATQPGLISCQISLGLTCVPTAYAHRSALLTQSHQVTFSAASVADLITFLFASPVIPNSLNTLQSDRPANPLQPTSEGSQRVCQPCLLHSSAFGPDVEVCWTW